MNWISWSSSKLKIRIADATGMYGCSRGRRVLHTGNADDLTSIHLQTDVLEIRAEGKGHVDLCADSLNEAANFGEVGRHVERAVARADDVHAR